MIIKGWNTKWSGKDDTVLLRKRGVYADGSTCFGVDDPVTGEVLVTAATVCLMEYNESPSEGNVFIKDYSENEGVLAALQKAGVVGDVIRTVPYYSVSAQEVPLLIDFEQPAWAGEQT